MNPRRERVRVVLRMVKASRPGYSCGESRNSGNAGKSVGSATVPNAKAVQGQTDRAISARLR
jgi:hypothetical protein